MSLFAAGAPQISAMEPRILKSQFHARNGRGRCLFMSWRGLYAKRHGALARTASRYKAPRRDKSVQRPYCAMRAILAILLLCTAFGCGPAKAEPSAETIARGKVLTNAG